MSGGKEREGDGEKKSSLKRREKKNTRENEEEEEEGRKDMNYRYVDCPMPPGFSSSSPFFSHYGGWLPLCQQIYY